MGVDKEADRFFARVDSFIVSCPRCGTVNGRWRGINNKQVFAKSYDPKTAVYICPGCWSKFAVGLVLYGINKYGGKRKIPIDCVPDPRQALGLRQIGEGIWPKKLRLGPNQPVNQVSDEECSCYTPCAMHPSDYFRQKKGKLTAFGTVSAYDLELDKTGKEVEEAIGPAESSNQGSEEE